MSIHVYVNKYLTYTIGYERDYRILIDAIIFGYNSEQGTYFNQLSKTVTNNQFHSNNNNNNNKTMI